jgi:hypothetical protein
VGFGRATRPELCATVLVGSITLKIGRCVEQLIFSIG